MNLPDTKVKFRVGLSNGESLIEGKGILSIVAGEDSAWHKLQKYLLDNNLTIQSISLVVKDGGNRHFNLPHSNSRFECLSPTGFNCFRYFASDSDQENTEHYTVAEARFEGYKVQLWVSEIDTDKSWITVIPI